MPWILIGASTGFTVASIALLLALAATASGPAGRLRYRRPR